MKLMANEQAVDIQRRDRARVPLQGHGGLLPRLLTWYSRRTYGDVLDPGLAMMHHRRMLLAYLRFETALARCRRLDDNLKTLAVLTSAGVLQCSWCMDFGYYEARGKGLDVSKLRDLPRWRESAAYTAQERRVMAYAEAMTVVPMEVTDDQVRELRDDLGDAALVELTMMVAVENQRSRFNSALGLQSQGFRERCELPG